MDDPLKKELKSFVLEKLGADAIGIASADDFKEEDFERIKILREAFAESTPLSGGDAQVYQPKDFLSGAKSVIVVGANSYFGNGLGINEAKKELLGSIEETHVDIDYLSKNALRSAAIADFLKGKGYQCFSLSGGGFPIKLKASECGVGRYGKNSVIQNRKLGSWISLSAFVTDAELELDEPLKEDCGECSLCIEACPTKAIEEPYTCNVWKCLDFNLGHNKKNIPEEIRNRTGNLLGEGCRICRDACPSNRNLKPVLHGEISKELIAPELTSILSISDDEWEMKYAPTLFGFFLIEKKYLQRNAAIALGNFRDERATEPLINALENEDEIVKEYSAWALGKIKTPKAKAGLEKALRAEQDKNVKKAIIEALESCK